MLSSPLPHRGFDPHCQLLPGKRLRGPCRTAGCPQHSSLPPERNPPEANIATHCLSLAAPKSFPLEERSSSSTGSAYQSRSFWEVPAQLLHRGPPPRPPKTHGNSEPCLGHGAAGCCLLNHLLVLVRWPDGSYPGSETRPLCCSKCEGLFADNHTVLGFRRRAKSNRGNSLPFRGLQLTRR